MSERFVRILFSVAASPDSKNAVQTVRHFAEGENIAFTTEAEGGRYHDTEERDGSGMRDVG